MPGELTPALLASLALEPAAAAGRLAAAGLANAAGVASLARAALAQAETDPPAAAAWLDAAQVLQAALTPDPALAAQLLYARARLQAATGDLTGAEESLQGARSLWRDLNDQASLARSGLGLTQILTAQGRYAEAEHTIQTTITILEQLGEAALLQRLAADQNLATLLSYQERHREALVVLVRVHSQLLTLLAAADPEEQADLLARCGRVEMAIALAHTYLDEPTAAVQALTAAIDRLSAANALLDRGRARTNLGALLARMGQFAAAREQLNLAAPDLFGTFEIDAVPERWAPAGAFFLEQAVVELALNLLPEAERALARGSELFRRTNQPYELGQALYYQALLALPQADGARAGELLAEAHQLFTSLDNRYWQHRVALAAAGLALHTGDLAAATTQTAALLAGLAAVAGGAAAQPVTQPRLAWDQAMIVELHLLRSQLALAAGDLPASRQAAATAATALGLADVADTGPALLPQLHLRLLAALAQLEQAAGAPAAARRYLVRAIDLLEATRATLPLEELRTAYLADKATLYADLVVSLLDAPEKLAAAVTDAFLVVERARARALLERLVGVLDAPAAAQPAATADEAALEALRQELVWRYNRLLGEEGSRRTSPTLTQEIQAREAALQQHVLRGSGWLAQAEPVALADLQQALVEDQQAIVYYGAGQELMAFVVSRDQAAVVRRVCTLPALHVALAEFRFQLGRVEIGGDYVTRHRDRLLSGVRSALHRLYTLAAAPLEPLITAARLQIIPFGPLHLLPFHALWDGAAYWQARHTFTYAASASIVVQLQRQAVAPAFTSLAALAVHDAAIPQAVAEVKAAAAHFATAQLLLADQADFAGLQQAATEADVLHIATHGLFRPDNPFFSALKLADSWIDVRQIYRLPLRARLVVLSACESGAVQVQGNDEPIGLVRGFLGAGARHLVVSLWNVHDASAARLMEQFYAILTTATTPKPAVALHRAQLAAAETDLHPYYWAPYVCIG